MPHLDPVIYEFYSTEYWGKNCPLILYQIAWFPLGTIHKPSGRGRGRRGVCQIYLVKRSIKRGGGGSKSPKVSTRFKDDPFPALPRKVTQISIRRSRPEARYRGRGSLFHQSLGRGQRPCPRIDLRPMPQIKVKGQKNRDMSNMRKKREQTSVFTILALFDIYYNTKYSSKAPLVSPSVLLLCLFHTGKSDVYLLNRVKMRRPTKKAI